MIVHPNPIALLRSRGIAFERRRNGVHLVIRHGNRVWDLWPKTQRWRERDRSAVPGELAVHRTSRQSGSGVDELIRLIEGAPGDPVDKWPNSSCICLDRSDVCPSGKNIQKTVSGCCKWDTRNDSSVPSRHTKVAGPQGACLSEKPSAREVMPARIDQTIPGNAAPIAPWPVTPRGVSHAGNTEYPDRKTEEGHGEKGEVLPKRTEAA